MNQERLEEIKRIYNSDGRGLMWDTIRELIVEVEWLRDNLQALIELTAIREEQLQDEFKEIERLRTKCNALIDALGEADHASYYPRLIDKEALDSRNQIDPLYQQKQGPEWREAGKSE